MSAGKSVASALIGLTVAVAPAVARDAQPVTELEEIVVTASLRDLALQEVPASVTVLPASLLAGAGLQHFQDVLGLVPNLNWSGATSRPRFFQLRGIGELEDYQGAPNPSVGFLIDGIDFSGIGMPATTFDVEQIEVLRGPQGTSYGANGLAGLIKVRTRDADGREDLRAEVSGGQDGLRSAAVAAAGALGDTAEAGGWRLAVQQFQQDGFRQNVFLGREDTNGRDELTVRGKLRLNPAEGWRIDLTAMHVNLDNGFDAFSPSNGLVTYSDQPGKDAQRSSAGAVAVTGDLGAARLESVTTYADSAMLYSFDGDWGNNAYWGANAPYQYFSRYDRRRRTGSEDLRLVSKSSAEDGGTGWVAGLYALRLEEFDEERDWSSGEPMHAPLVSDYGATNLAAYGEVEQRLPGALTLTGGLRVETRGSSYHDSAAIRFAPHDTMWGGQLSLRGDLDASDSWYVTLGRGYKAGGFNIGQDVPANRKEFFPEYLWNLEAGLHFADAAHRLTGEVALFYMWRDQQQVQTSFQLNPNDPLSYVFYTDNAASGRNYGLEGSLNWRPLEALELGATLGLLGSEYLHYRYGDLNLDGRQQAHAPGYQYSLSAQWGLPRGWFARADLSGVDWFYFDTSNDTRSWPYRLLNLKVGYAADHWSVYAWGRNVGNTDYAVRGFYFGLEPPDFPNKLYWQRGDPRSLGVTVAWHLH